MYSTPLKSRVDYSTSTFAGTQSLSAQGDAGADAAMPTGSNGSVYAASGPLSSLAANTASGLTSAATNLLHTNEHLRVNGFGNMKPLDLASQYIDHLERRDANSPILDERSYYNNGVNYNFSRDVGGLGAFTPFERQKIINIPDEILHEASQTETKNDIGIFPELDRCWITVDNKLILWNLNNSTEFQTIEDIKHTILTVALVKPRPNTFVDIIKHLLIIATPFDIYILAVSYERESNELNVFNTGMSVSVHGLDVFNIVSCDKTGQIFFAGKNNGLNIWELQYSASDDWFNSKCTKVCLTQSALSSLLPTNIVSKFPGSSLVQSLFEEDSKYSQETIIQLEVDQSRSIIYSLSTKSIVRAYFISKSKLEGPVTIEPSYIRRIMGTTTARGAPILGSKYLKISKITTVSQQENSNLFLLAVTIGGVRLYFNGSVGRSSIEALRLESVKFPPSSVTPQVIQQELQKEQLEQQKRTLPFYSSLQSSESVLLKYQKKSSVLLETSSASTIISPGIFFSAVIKKPAENEKLPVMNDSSSKHQHKLFVSVPDYGILKNHGKYIENATFLDTTGPVKSIVPLTATFNATYKQEGYSNVFASQYNAENMRVAVITNNCVEIYRYRMPDEIFEALIDNPLPFILNYGISEACSTALYVTCKSNKEEALRSAALTFFTVGIPGVVDIKPKYNKYASSTVSSLLSQPSLISTPQKSLTTYPQTSVKNSTGTNFSLEDVFLSPRFYGIALLITRLFRDIWAKQLFFTATQFKNSNKSTTSLSAVLQDENSMLGISITKGDIEYYLSSVNILHEFFTVYGNSITSVYTPLVLNGNSTVKNIDKSQEVATQAENIAINSLMKLVQSIKEALSFLNVLYDETELEGVNRQNSLMKDIIKFLSPAVQESLMTLKYKDIFAPTEHVKELIGEILSSIINRNLSRGASIEHIATALQERCGSFCSGSDILGFRAVEHLRKAKEIGFKDSDRLTYHLDTAIRLFERIIDDISLEKIKEASLIMFDLNYYPKAIEFLLTMANSLDKGKLAYQYVADGSLEHDERRQYYDKRIFIYDLVFEALVRVDEAASKNITSGNIAVAVSNEWAKLKENSYACALQYNDQLFHYKLYDWLVSQKQQDQLLQLDTKFILPYLEEKSKNSLEISNLFWVYHSKRSHFFEAAEILYSLAISDFDVKLGERISWLSRANGFCNTVCATTEKRKMMLLAGVIQELFDIAAVQDDILSLVLTDSRIKAEDRDELVKKLDGKFLSVSELFNDFAVPLGYFEICLMIYKVSDFRDQEEIMNTWHELFDSLKNELESGGKLDDSIKFINLVSSVVTKIGRNVQASEFVFPISSLFPIISNMFVKLLPIEHIRPGTIASIFISAGISHSKLYYILRNLIETGEGSESLDKQEILWLIKDWYQSDRKLKNIIQYQEIAELKDTYDISTDPLERYMKKTGNSV